MQNKKTTYRFRLIFLFLLSVLWFGNVNAQQDKVDDFWKAYIEALKKDQVHGQNLKKQREKECIEREVLQQKDLITACLDKKYSKGNVSETLKRITELKKFMQKHNTVENSVQLYEELIKNYDDYAKKFIRVFHIDTIADQRYHVLVSMEKTTLIPTHITHILKCIKEKYENNGLSNLTFRPEYKYLNRKLELLKKIFEEIPKMSDTKKMYSRLEELLKIESEISEEHKSYYHIK